MLYCARHDVVEEATEQFTEIEIRYGQYFTNISLNISEEDTANEVSGIAKHELKCKCKCARNSRKGASGTRLSHVAQARYDD